MDHSVFYDEKTIIQIINNIFPPAYQTIEDHVSVKLLKADEDICQIYGQLQQQQQYFGRQLHSKQRPPIH
jgi:hypothetical protein